MDNNSITKHKVLKLIFESSENVFTIFNTEVKPLCMTGVPYLYFTIKESEFSEPYHPLAIIRYYVFLSILHFGTCIQNNEPDPISGESYQSIYKSLSRALAPAPLISEDLFPQIISQFINEFNDTYALTIQKLLQDLGYTQNDNFISQEAPIKRLRYKDPEPKIQQILRPYPKSLELSNLLDDQPPFSKLHLSRTILK